MQIKHLIAGGAAALALGAAAQASAAVVVLGFDQLNGGSNEGPLNYYNGGLGSLGTGPGPNDGIVFSANTITGCVHPFACANTNSALAPSAPNVIFFLSGGADTMDVAAGFNTGFSFFYSSVNVPGVVNVWSGLDGTGTLLASLNLPVTPTAGDPGCGGQPFCPYFKAGVSFAGTAMSVDFGGTANQIAFDDITLGSANPGVPEPASWALMLLGVGAVGFGLRRQSKAALAA
ncbi:MAG: PEPxxWA-CTERM sorting domain-containing protein [Caulobacteraceae bacterium]